MRFQAGLPSYKSTSATLIDRSERKRIFLSFFFWPPTPADSAPHLYPANDPDALPSVGENPFRCLERTERKSGAKREKEEREREMSRIRGKSVDLIFQPDSRGPAIEARSTV